MGYIDLLRHIEESLAGFYDDAGRYFWFIFNETPQAAVAAFKSRPETFGPFIKAYSDWPKMRAREHARISERLLLLLAEHPPDVPPEPLNVAEDVPV